MLSVLQLTLPTFVTRLHAVSCVRSVRPPPVPLSVRTILSQVVLSFGLCWASQNLGPGRSGGGGCGGWARVLDKGLLNKYEVGTSMIWRCLPPPPPKEFYSVVATPPPPPKTFCVISHLFLTYLGVEHRSALDRHATLRNCGLAQ